MSPDLIFFYGTLMSRGTRGGYLSGYAEPTGPGTIEGLLYIVGGGAFPAYLPGEGTIVGEVWQPLGGSDSERIRNMDAALMIADQIEGYDPGGSWSMYVRESVLLGDGRRAWTYRWNSGPEGLDGPVPSGSWEAWRESWKAVHR